MNPTTKNKLRFGNCERRALGPAGKRPISGIPWPPVAQRLDSTAEGEGADHRPWAPAGPNAESCQAFNPEGSSPPMGEEPKTTASVCARLRFSSTDDALWRPTRRARGRQTKDNLSSRGRPQQRLVLPP